MRAATAPPPTKLSKEGRELMQECASEFVSFVVSEAAERAAASSGKMVNAADVLASLHALGFEGYVEPLRAYLEQFRAVRGRRHPRQHTVRSRRLGVMLHFAGGQGREEPGGRRGGGGRGGAFCLTYRGNCISLNKI